MDLTNIRKPEWLKVKLDVSKEFHEIKQLMRSQTLHTVCEEANCPNIYECWSNRTATFMILGDICTRACRFCAVTSGKPTELDLQEPLRVAEVAMQMGLKHTVVTSVARDDLQDGGAAIFAETILKLREKLPMSTIEVLIPDFLGSLQSLKTVLDAHPDILNHNIETVRRLSDRVRSKAKYERSLALLSRSKLLQPSIPTKSSIMVGLGEETREIEETMDDLRSNDVNILTLGQYLQPSKLHLPVTRYYHPDDFAELKSKALQLGFSHVEAGPFVRSSYHAHEQAKAVVKRDDLIQVGSLPSSRN